MTPHAETRLRQPLRAVWLRFGLALAAVAAVAGCNDGDSEAAAPPEATEYRATTATRLSFAVRGGGNGTQFALTQAPDGLLIDAQTGQVEWVPQPEQLGPHAVTVAVTDPSGATTQRSYQIEVAAAEGLPAYLVLATDAVAYTPGQPVRARWRLGGDLPADASIELGLFAPAVDPAAPGGAPTTWTLAADGSWSAGTVKLQAAARAGEASLTLPNRLSGHWAIVLRLLDADGQLLAAATQRVLVADAPALRLTLSRPVAKPLDPVAAEVDVALGPVARPARLVAWLVHPDGRRVGLPNQTPAKLEVAAGDAIGGRYPLLDREFSADEAGVYRIHARLYAAADGRLLQEAAAKFTVCAATASVSGRVTRPDRAPLDGSALPLAVVSASGLDSAGSTEIASVSDQGRYRLALGPGRYLVRALAVGADSTRLESEAAVLAVGCDAGPIAHDLALRTR